jgi:hypothetical protein
MNKYRRLQTKQPINYSKVFNILGVCFCAFSIVPLYFSMALGNINLIAILGGMFASGAIMIVLSSIEGDI